MTVKDGVSSMCSRQRCRLRGDTSFRPRLACAQRVTRPNHLGRDNKSSIACAPLAGFARRKESVMHGGCRKSAIEERAAGMRFTVSDPASTSKAAAAIMNSVDPGRSWVCVRCAAVCQHRLPRWPDGLICRTCQRKALRRRGICPDGGTDRLLPGQRGEAAICRDCAGIADFAVRPMPYRGTAPSERPVRAVRRERPPARVTR